MATTQYYGLYIITVDDTMDKLQTGNEAKIDTALHGLRADVDDKKPKQTAKTDPTASGTSLTFLATFSQNANGEVTVTKKTVSTMGGASSGAAGSAGLVPQPAAGAQAKFLRGDGTWQNTPYPSNATTAAAGLMSSTDKSKLDGIQSGAQVNPGVATTSANGLMSKDDKTKLNGIETGAQKNPGVATTSANGLMSKDDKTKLNGIESGAQKNPAVATSSANGLMSKTDKAKLDGFGAATSSVYGFIKIGYVSDDTHRGVALDSNGKAYVQLQAAASGAYGVVKLGYSESAANSNRALLLDANGKAYVDCGIASGASYGLARYGFTQTGKKYPVQGDTYNRAYVEVPWTNTWRGFAKQSFSYNYTVPANGSKDITGSNFGVGKSGYTPVAAYMFNSGSPDLIVAAFNAEATGNNVVMTVKNPNNGAISAQAWIGILYLQNT